MSDTKDVERSVKDPAMMDSVDDYAEGDTVRVVDHQAEKALALKFDIRILPVLAVMCKFTAC